MADKNKVYDGINKAMTLMNSPEFNMLVEQKAGGFSGRNRKGRSGSNDLAAFEAQAGFGGGSSSRQTPSKNMASIDEIKESFRQIPAMSGGYGQSASAAYYAQTQQRQMVTEQQQPVYQQQPQSYGGVPIDYNYIKYIVNECIKEALKTQLNESASLSGLKMVGGNKIQFMDTKGNVFEGVLRKVQQ